MNDRIAPGVAHRAWAAFRGALVPAVAFALIGCGGWNDDELMRYEGSVVSVQELKREIAADRYDELRDDPERLVERAVRNVALRTHLTADPPTDRERAILETVSFRRASDRCVTTQLKKGYLTRTDVEADAQAYFEAHREEFAVPETFRLQMVFLPETDPGAAALARDILRRVQADPDSFGDLAERHSRSRTAANRGFTAPMPGDNVDPAVRRQVMAHRQSADPFLVHTDRGYYVMRVVEYVEGAPAELHRVRGRVLAAAQRELVESAYSEVRRETEEAGTLEVRERLFFEPRIETDEIVYSLGDVRFTVSDLLPAWEPGRPLSGPAVRLAQERHQRWYLLARHLGCLEGVKAADDADLLYSLRLEPALEAFAASHMQDEVSEFLDIHREAFRRPARYRLDLYVLPFQTGDPFADLKRYRDTIEALRAGETSAADDRVLSFEGVEMNEDELTAYAPHLIPFVRRLEPELLSSEILSESLRAFVLVRVLERADAVPLETPTDRDRERVVSGFVDELHERVMDRMFEQVISAEIDINRRAVVRVKAELAGPGAETGEGIET